MIILRDYQKEAVAELKERINRLLNKPNNPICIFKAPTGSGKTIMMAEFLKEFIEHRDDHRSFAFIWAAPRKLHIQSKEKLEQYYFDNKALRCSFFEDLMDKKISGNEILFLNWESINKRDNIYIRENEQENNLSKILENTRDDGQEIILIIDESHHAAQTETSQNLIRDIDPEITIELSATPHLSSDYRIVVELSDVKREGVIKKEIAINPEFQNIKVGGRSADEIVLEAAIGKREELAKAYKEEGSNINPLVLIQLPDRRIGSTDKKDEIVALLKKKDITVDNGRLAIYLSENKENLANIAKDDNDAEVMIFKQAIALGWDCPRASILVLFRDWRSIIFSIQTIGRIMRMPELKHYENYPELNLGYVYTNLSDISIQEDLAKDYITVFESKRRPDYKLINLASYHSKRFREETRLTPIFIPIFLNAAKELRLKEKIDLKVKTSVSELIAEGRIKELDHIVEHVEKAGTVEIDQTILERQGTFSAFIRDALSPLYPEPRSIGRVRDSIYRFFLQTFEINYEEEQEKIMNIVLNKQNNEYFRNVIDRAKELYLEEVGRGKKELTITDKWNIPEKINFNSFFEKKTYKKSIMQLFFSDTRKSRHWKTEENFFKHLERTDGIDWWFKNGDRDAIYFAVPYTESGIDMPFYVDFIIKMKDGRIGLFDTKSGIIAKIAGPKAEGLAKYIKEQNKKGKKLFGGIVIQKDSNWFYNNSEKYDEADPKQWKLLDLDKVI